VSLAEGLTDPDYRKASWLCVYLAIGNQMSGINIVNIYAFFIFNKIMTDSGAEMPMSPKTMTYFIGASGLLGAVLGNFTVKQFSRRGLVIGGHVWMGVCLTLVAITIHLNLFLMALIFMCAFVIVFQSSVGPIFFVYCAETVIGSVMGICAFILMTCLFIQSVVTI